MTRILLTILAIGLLAACESSTEPEPGDYAVIDTWMGTGQGGALPGGTPLRETRLSTPMDLTFGPDGAAYVADWNNHRLLRAADGIAEVICGTGTLGFADEGPALDAGLNHPTHIAFDPEGRLIFAAWHNSKIMRLDFNTEEIVRLAGVEPENGTNSNRGYNGDDQPAIDAWLDLPVATAFDSDGNMYIADQKNVLIRRVLPVNGEITDTSATENQSFIERVVGVEGSEGYNGDGLDPLETWLNAPGGQAAPPTSRIAIRDDVLYFADTVNNVVRSLDLKDANATVQLVAGGGQGVNQFTGVPNPTDPDNYAETSGDGGPATQGTLSYPTDIAFDSVGNMYISDTFNSRVRKVDTEGNISTFAGRGRNVANPTATGDGGHPTLGYLDRPYGVAVDADDNVYIADTYHHRIRIVRK